MIHVIGNALQPVGDKVFIIAHVCNNRGVMGAGIAAAISKLWPVVPELFHQWHMQGFQTLGEVQFVPVKLGERPGLIANMVAQTLEHHFPLSMPHLEDCIRRVDYEYPSGMTRNVHIPRIGAGLARGHWEDIEYLIPGAWFCYTLPTEVGRYPVPKTYRIAPELQAAFGGRTEVLGAEGVELCQRLARGETIEVEI